MAPSLRLAFVTDIHHGADKLTKLGSQALPLIEQFVAFANDYAPDAVIELGDRISDIGPSADRDLLADVAGALQPLDAPLFHILGNHDVNHLSPADNAAILGQSFDHQSIDINGWHLVFWQADTRISRETGFQHRPSDLDWLRQDLESAANPTILFSHLPLDDAAMHGNYYFQRNQRFATYSDCAAIRAVIENSGNVVLCVAGHLHWNNLNRIDGIPYITVQSLTESYTTPSRPAGAWASIEIGDNICWRTHGEDAIEVSLPLASRNARWVAPLPRFEELLRAEPGRGDLAGIKGILLDLDGVIYRGDEPVAGAAHFLETIRAAGIEVLALTNNARADADAYADKLNAMGIPFAADRILTAGAATAAYLSTLSSKPRVRILGSTTLRREILAAGALEVARPDYVVVGYDPALTIEDLSSVVDDLRRGAKLIATNLDATLPVGAGLTAECGAVVAFLETAGATKATIVGKPSSIIFEQAQQCLGLAGDDVLMIGDTLATDIAGGNAAGLRTALVATGNPPENDGATEPSVRVTNLAELIDLLPPLP